MATTTMVKVKAGECIILPGNAQIVAAITAGADPSVDSPDCPDLADAIQTAIDSNNFVDANITFMDSNYVSKNRANFTPNYEDVSLTEICIAGNCYNVPDVEVDSGIGGPPFGLGWSKPAAIAAWQKAFDMTNTPYAGLFKVLDIARSNDGDKGRSGNTITLTVRGPQNLIDNALFKLSARRMNNPGGVVLFAKFGNL